MKQTKYLYSLLLALFILQTSVAQETQQRYIDVLGSAEMEVTPDIIKLSITLLEYELDRKLVTLTEIEEGFLKAVDGAEVPDDKIVVTRVSSNAYNTKRKRKAFASKTYELTFSDQKGLLNFTRRLKNADISNMYISHLSHTKLTDYRLEVKKEALLAARNKAKALVEVVDAQLGEVLTINENDQFSPQYKPTYLTMSNTAMSPQRMASDTGADEIGFKKIMLRFEISARFAIQ